MMAGLLLVSVSLGGAWASRLVADCPPARLVAAGNPRRFVLPSLVASLGFEPDAQPQLPSGRGGSG